MKKILAFLLFLSGFAPLFAQKPNYAYRLPETPDMPAWATKLYRDDLTINVFAIDEAFETWEKTYEAEERPERDEWTDHGEEPGFEENRWEEYYERWRTAVEPFVQSDGSLLFDKKFLPNCQPNQPKADAPESGTTWSLIGPEKTYWAKNDMPSQPLAPW